MRRRQAKAAREVLTGWPLGTEATHFSVEGLSFPRSAGPPLCRQPVDAACPSTLCKSPAASSLRRRSELEEPRCRWFPRETRSARETSAARIARRIPGKSAVPLAPKSPGTRARASPGPGSHAIRLLSHRRQPHARKRQESPATVVASPTCFPGCRPCYMAIGHA